MNHTYLFYDIETTGLNPCFDQVVQFAAIRTDLDLKPIEQHEIFVRLMPDVIPSPEATITHQMNLHSPHALSEWEAMRQIHHWFNIPGTISLGYNTLGFDDEFLRFSFYRNLLPCYTHQYAQGCSRRDLYPMTVLYALYAPHVLRWPIKENKLSLKLEDLSEANVLASGSAHNAWVDVEATLALAKKLKAQETLWPFIQGYFDKQTDISRLNGLRFALAVQGQLGHKNQFQAPVLPLGQHQHYKNQSLWLRLDQEALLTLQVDEIAEKTMVLRKRAGEPPIILPPKDRYLQKINAERLACAEATRKHLEKQPQLLQAIQDYHQHFKYPTVPNVDADAALYQLDFMSSRDLDIARKIHSAEPSQWVALAKRFQEPTYQTITHRLLGRHHPERLPLEEKQNFDAYLSGIYQEKDLRTDYKGRHQLTPSACLAAIQTLQNQHTLSSQQCQLLNQLQTLIQSRQTLPLTS